MNLEKVIQFAEKMKEAWRIYALDAGEEYIEYEVIKDFIGDYLHDNGYRELSKEKSDIIIWFWYFVDNRHLNPRIVEKMRKQYHSYLVDRGRIEASMNLERVVKSAIKEALQKESMDETDMIVGIIESQDGSAIADQARDIIENGLESCLRNDRINTNAISYIEETLEELTDKFDLAGEVINEIKEYGSGKMKSEPDFDNVERLVEKLKNIDKDELESKMKRIEDVYMFASENNIPSWEISEEYLALDEILYGGE